jgi:spore coat polysaccharide biosynthesis predicted glycosyltransferase SpsG
MTGKNMPKLRKRASSSLSHYSRYKNSNVTERLMADCGMIISSNAYPIIRSDYETVNVASKPPSIR